MTYSKTITKQDGYISAEFIGDFTLTSAQSFLLDLEAYAQLWHIHRFFIDYTKSKHKISASDTQQFSSYRAKSLGLNLNNHYILLVANNDDLEKWHLGETFAQQEGHHVQVFINRADALEAVKNHGALSTSKTSAQKTVELEKSSTFISVPPSSLPSRR